MELIKNFSSLLRDVVLLHIEEIRTERSFTIQLACKVGSEAQERNQDGVELRGPTKQLCDLTHIVFKLLLAI